MSKAFVTGANGFIGSHLIAALLARGDEVVGMVRPTSDTRSLQPLFDQYGDKLRLVTGDLREPGTLGAGLQDAEYVYHLAAALMVTSEAAFRETNVDGVRNLLEAVRQHNDGSLKRVLFTSSMAGAGPAPSPEPIDETREPQPVSWYGKSKRDAEAIVHEFSAQGMPITIVRPVAVYGEREDLLARSAFPAVKMGLLPRLGFDKKLASFVYVGDLVEGIVCAAESANSIGKTYFLANPTIYEGDDIPNAVADAMNQRIRIPVVTPVPLTQVGAWFFEWMYLFTGAKPLATSDKVRETKFQYWIVSPKAAERDFGWVARTSLKDGMKKTVDYWNAEQDALRRRALMEPRTARIVKTFTLTTAIGLFEALLDLIVGGITFFGLASFLGISGSPAWLTLVAITVTFAVLMGLVSLWTAGRSAVVQFLGGAAVGFTLEILNQLVLHWWEWNPATFGALQGALLPAIVLGGAAGLYPLIVNAVVAATYQARLRLGVAA
jgi:nucleoside-diphosphate-sugar epimerase